MTNRQSTHGPDCWGWGPKHYEGELAMSIDTEALKERIYALEADLDTAQHADHEETIRALVVAADRLEALEAELASVRTDRYESRATTHASVCWSWGPAHYECAVGQIWRDEALLRQALDALEILYNKLFQMDEHVDSTGIRKGYAAIISLRERLIKGEQP